VTAVEAPAPLLRTAMTPRQLARRARLLEAVVEIVTEVGPQALQMREVAERSGVALGTAYKYFRSREQLMAAALAEWQQPLMSRMASVSRSRDASPGDLVSAYLRRALRAFHRNPHMGALMVLMQTSADPDVVETLAEMGTRSTAVMEQMLDGLPPDAVPHVSRGLEAVLMNSVTSLVTGRATLDEALDRVQGVARLLLAGAGPAGAPTS
jgi:AcrR family transcriptional regulator